MKWWGWGSEDVTYPLMDRPYIRAFLQSRLGVDAERTTCPAVSQREISLRPTRLPEPAARALRATLGDQGLVLSDLERFKHSFGKSYRDLLRARAGRSERPTDGVAYPATEEAVTALVALAQELEIALIPFGGGTSVVGGVEPPPDEPRPVLTVNLQRLNRARWVRPECHLAEFEAGILGPDLERELSFYDMTLGHFPQSFEFSTLGGWIAARSAGQASTYYGRIEDLVESLTTVTPVGIIETLPVPATATGPSVKQLMIGSEGIYGLITRAVMRLHPRPSVFLPRALLFRTLRDGATALRTLMDAELRPAIARLSDEEETRSIFALRHAPQTAGKALKELVGQAVLGLKNYSFERGCLLLLMFEGTREADLNLRQNEALSIARGHGAFDLGASPTAAWRQERFRHPYLRDHFMDWGIMVDTLETATTWDNVLDLHSAVRKAIHLGFAEAGAPGIVLCHLSHLYATGASLYFTFLAPQRKGRELEQWETVKRYATEAIIAGRGTLSHHHGVGRDHRSWLAAELSAPGVAALEAARSCLDPARVLNPGCVLPWPGAKGVA
ncbi:MAG: FAD-binding oxidoreductase [Candidatus Schekmanbacteria bacterium]|nr:FAD-binding oxidoreductase [Candidatus Schekmanbacteria bacterium]